MPDPADAHKPAHFHPSDLRALARLLTDATAGVTNLVEAVHIGIAAPDYTPRAGGIAPLTYRSIRGITRVVAGGLDVALAPLAAALGPRAPTPERRLALAAVNGIVGDYLAETGSALALPMTLHRDGAPLAVDRAALAATFPEPRGKLLLLVHGLCGSDRGWARGGGQCGDEGSDYGAALARDLVYTPRYLNYNSGRHVSANGRDLAALLEALVSAWPAPVDELAILAHSMGGLVARSAAHYGAAAGHAWPARLRALVCLGTPHHGAPLERGGNWINVLLEATPYVAPFGRLGKGRSAGITDLRYGNLLDEDWQGRDRFAPAVDERTRVPLPAAARCYAAAAVLAGGVETPADRLLGDGLVPLDSALGRHADPARSLAFDGEWIGRGLGHLDLLGRAEVYAQVVEWFAG